MRQGGGTLEKGGNKTRKPLEKGGNEGQEELWKREGMRDRRNFGKGGTLEMGGNEGQEVLWEREGMRKTLVNVKGHIIQS